jgi:hypothetical protein
LSSILDTLLIIHFPSELKDLLNDSWVYYDSHGNSLFNLIIDIQTSIEVQRSSARELTKAKQREKRQAPRAIGDEEAWNPLLSDVGPSEQPLNESTSRKRQALEQITNTQATKRQRAPRSVQPSVAQVLEGYRPQYRTRQNAESSSGGDNGKENEGRRVSVRSRNN